MRALGLALRTILGLSFMALSMAADGSFGAKEGSANSLADAKDGSARLPGMTRKEDERCWKSTQMGFLPVAEERTDKKLLEYIQVSLLC